MKLTDRQKTVVSDMVEVIESTFDREFILTNLISSYEDQGATESFTITLEFRRIK